MSGILSIARECLVLYSPNLDIIQQRQSFWSFVWIAFIISAIAAWVIEHRKANRFSKLDIEFKDIFLTYLRPHSEWTDDNAMTFLTIVFSITNPNSEVNTIKSCRFFIYKKRRFFVKTDKIEGERRNSAFLKNGETGRTHGHLDTVVFQQGIPQDYASTFKFDEDNNPFASNEANLADKPFTVFLVDSYNKEYKYNGRTSKDLMKTLTRFNYH